MCVFARESVRMCLAHTHTSPSCVVTHVVRQALVTWPLGSAYCSYESLHHWTATGQEKRGGGGSSASRREGIEGGGSGGERQKMQEENKEGRSEKKKWMGMMMMRWDNPLCLLCLLQPTPQHPQLKRVTEKPLASRQDCTISKRAISSFQVMMANGIHVCTDTRHCFCLQSSCSRAPQRLSRSVSLVTSHSSITWLSSPCLHPEPIHTDIKAWKGEVETLCIELQRRSLLTSNNLFSGHWDIFMTHLWCLKRFPLMSSKFYPFTL